jgi:hypothetical protein
MKLNGLRVIITPVNVFEDQDIHDSFVHDCPLVIIYTDELF